jgi:hypothetical protein
MASAQAPRLVAGLVERPRLFELLDRGTQGPVTLVAAPAGSGKTMLVSSWLRSAETATAWVSVERDETDATHFWGMVLDAVRSSGALGPDDPLTTLVPGEQVELVARLREGFAKLPEPLLLSSTTSSPARRGCARGARAAPHAGARAAAHADHHPARSQARAPPAAARGRAHRDPRRRPRLHGR